MTPCTWLRTLFFDAKDEVAMRLRLLSLHYQRRNGMVLAFTSLLIQHWYGMISTMTKLMILGHQVKEQGLKMIFHVTTLSSFEIRPSIAEYDELVSLLEEVWSL
jgi:hypothetical protein